MTIAFDYGAEAELYPIRTRSTRPPFGYRRFARAADAIQFAVERLQPGVFLATSLEVGEERFDSEGIRRLYESADFPLQRRCIIVST
jgi:hypothetical protein